MPRPKKTIVASGDTPIVSEVKFPFKDGQVVCDLKIVKIDLDAERGIGYKLALRRDMVTMGDRGEKITIPRAIVRDPQTRKVVWEDYVHQMSPGDFQTMVDMKKQVEAEVE